METYGAIAEIVWVVHMVIAMAGRFLIEDWSVPHAMLRACAIAILWPLLPLVFWKLWNDHKPRYGPDMPDLREDLEGEA